MDIRGTNTFEQDKIDWKGWVKAILWHQYVYYGNDFSGYEIMVKPFEINGESVRGYRKGDIVGDTRILSYSIGETRRLTWRELALCLGLWKENLLTDGHNCQKCPDHKKCKAYFKDDKKQLRCSGWTDDKTLDERYQEFMDEIMKPLAPGSILKTLTDEEIKELEKYGIFPAMIEEIKKMIKDGTDFEKGTND